MGPTSKQCEAQRCHPLFQLLPLSSSSNQWRSRFSSVATPVCSLFTLVPYLALLLALLSTSSFSLPPTQCTSHSSTCSSSDPRTIIE